MWKRLVPVALVAGLALLLSGCSTSADPEPPAEEIVSEDNPYVRNCTAHLDLFLESYYEIPDFEVTVREHGVDASDNHQVTIVYNTEVETASQFSCSYISWDHFVKRTGLQGYPEPTWRMVYPESYRHNGRKLADEARSVLYRDFVRMDSD